MNALTQWWRVLRHRTALTDPRNVGFVVVCWHCDAEQPDNLRDTCATCGRDLRRQP